MPVRGFDTTVSARTRTAVQILGSPELLQGFVALGGLGRDLEGIRDAGQEAQAAHLGQSQAKAAGKGATVEVLSRLAGLQMEYSGVMAVVQVVRAELGRNGADQSLLAKLDGILKNETQVTVAVYEEDGKKKRRTRKSASHKALLEEIGKDAAALIALTEAHPALSERLVTPARLEALRGGAEEVSTLLGARATAKGAKMSATQSEYAAVGRQKELWSAAYRILSALGRRDDRVRSLLDQTKR